jgi:drug/metabolite transporter (DMT)-like permease
LTYLLLSIAASSLIFVIFKLFARYNINTLQAIVVNYVIAFTTGILTYNGDTTLGEATQSGWFIGAMALGIVFITVFNLMAITTQKSGLSVVSVATKMSVIIPITFGIFYYDESAAFLKIIGIVLALVAVYLASVKEKSILTNNSLLFPFLILVGSGIIDVSLKYYEQAHVKETDAGIFSATIFASAGVLGIIFIAYQLIKGKIKLGLKNVVAGIALGVPNYFSIYFLVQALRTEGFDSSTIFTLNNVSIVIFSTVLGILFFKERLLLKNWIGIALAVISIVLVTLA